MTPHPNEWWKADPNAKPADINPATVIEGLRRIFENAKQPRPPFLRVVCPSEYADEIARIKEREAAYAHLHYEDHMTTPAETPPPAESPDADPLAGLVRGRTVYYVPLPYEARNADPGPWPAVVTNVGPQPGQVSLNVHLPVPTMIGSDPVARRVEVPYSDSDAPGSWNWIPRT